MMNLYTTESLILLTHSAQRTDVLCLKSEFLITVSIKPRMILKYVYATGEGNTVD